MLGCAAGRGRPQAGREARQRTKSGRAFQSGAPQQCVPRCDGTREALKTRKIVLKDVNWLAAPSQAAECAVKVRSMRPPVPARVIATPDGAEVELLEPEEGVAPGQACVFYKGTQVLGGGWITKS